MVRSPFVAFVVLVTLFAAISCGPRSAEDNMLELGRRVNILNNTNHKYIVRIVQLEPQYEIEIGTNKHFELVRVSAQSRCVTTVACRPDMDHRIYYYIMLIFDDASKMPWKNRSQLLGYRYLEIDPSQQEAISVVIDDKDVKGGVY
jgi:hypothetical protein